MDDQNNLSQKVWDKLKEGVERPGPSDELRFYGSTRSMVELTQNLKHLKYLASEVCS